MTDDPRDGLGGASPLIAPAELAVVEASPVAERAAAYRLLQQRLQETLLTGPE